MTDELVMDLLVVQGMQEAVRCLQDESGVERESTAPPPLDSQPPAYHIHSQGAAGQHL